MNLRGSDSTAEVDRGEIRRWTARSARSREEQAQLAKRGLPPARCAQSQDRIRLERANKRRARLTLYPVLCLHTTWVGWGG